MKTYQHHDKFQELRAKFSTFTFESYRITTDTNKLTVEYHFHIDDRFHFRPQIHFIFNKTFTISNTSESSMRNLFFHCGMIELISYWKSTCAPNIVIKPFYLDTQQINWWKHLYFQGLGEFFYINGIETDQESFINIRSGKSKLTALKEPKLNKNKIIVPIGGGKDSPVSLELLKENGFQIIPLIINPRGASINTIKAANIPENDFFHIQRNIDKTLLKMNNEGYLNGHTPFSAMLAFYTLAAAVLSGSKMIALSNESSANESTVSGTSINHQYSKSFEFEKDFRAYYLKYINPEIEYFSFLRPLSELQIAYLFSKMTQYHEVFRSCNVGSKENKWCAHCSKCLFVAIILSPFLSHEKITKIIGRDILNDSNMLQYLHQLNGTSKVKPFECVGTTSEVSLALNTTYNKGAKNKSTIPLLIKEHISIQNTNADNIENALQEWNSEHFLPLKLEIIIKNALRIK